MSWRRGQTATYWPQVLLTIAALLWHSGWAAQLSVWSWFSLRWHPISNSNWLPSVSWLYFCLTSTYFLWAYASATITEFKHVHRSRWYSDIFTRMHLFRCSSTYLHRWISWLTARSRVNMLQWWWRWKTELRKISNWKFVSLYFILIPISYYYTGIHFDVTEKNSLSAALLISIKRGGNHAHQPHHTFNPTPVRNDRFECLSFRHFVSCMQ